MLLLNKQNLPRQQQRRASEVQPWTAKIFGKRVHLKADPRPKTELELRRLRKRPGYFREVFGRELFPTLA